MVQTATTRGEPLAGRAAEDRIVGAQEGQGDPERQIEQYRTELVGYCYRMLGSGFEAEDAVQETMIRAWKGLDRFEGRAALRSWLYRIATNVCFDMLSSRQRRARPMDLGPASTVEPVLPDPLPHSTWVEPIPDHLVMATEGADPAAVAEGRESVRLAFVAALQHLPPRQRAVLILREVLKWKASEVATLLDATVASVNSALQRARTTLQATDLDQGDPLPSIDDDQRALLNRYVEAFEAYDIDSLVSLLREDAIQSMPPYAMWLRGPAEIKRFLLGPGAKCRGSRVIPASTANGLPAFAHYDPNGPGGSFRPWALQVLRPVGNEIAELIFFLDTERLFPLFGLPAKP
jgi:RNA polymerase sigma-70 factor, ECF subfamily